MTILITHSYPDRGALLLLLGRLATEFRGPTNLMQSFMHLQCHHYLHRKVLSKYMCYCVIHDISTNSKNRAFKILLSKNTCVGHWETIVDCLESIGKSHQRWFQWECHLDSRGSLWFLRCYMHLWCRFWNNTSMYGWSTMVLYVMYNTCMYVIVWDEV